MAYKNRKPTPEENKNFINSRECCEHAERFVRLAVRTKTPQQLADLFYGNVYLNENLNGSASIFYKTLDLSTNSGYKGLLYHIHDEELKRDIYSLAFLDCAKKKYPEQEEVIERVARSMVKLK